MTLGKRLLVSTLCTFNALTIQVITQSVVPLPFGRRGHAPNCNLQRAAPAQWSRLTLRASTN